MESKQALAQVATDQPDVARSSQAKPFGISPPLLNSANPWATTKEDLLALYSCPYTGAVTVRTSLLKGFPHDPSIHQYTFFSAGVGYAIAEVGADGRSIGVAEGETSSLNTLGYSPIAFDEYLSIVREIVDADAAPREPAKPFIVSVTGTADEVGECYRRMAEASVAKPKLSLMMEVNLSCPNIPDKAPPAYDGTALSEYIQAIAKAKAKATAALGERASLHVGIKTPPYTYQGQYETLIQALEGAAVSFGPVSQESESESERAQAQAQAQAQIQEPHPISFITATNTLGSCLVMNAACVPALASSSSSTSPSSGSNNNARARGSGIGGLAGDAIHALSLGNVSTIRAMLDSSKQARLNRIAVIGVGGVTSPAAFQRMTSAGAAAVAVGTALGREGIPVFERLSLALSQADRAAV